MCAKYSGGTPVLNSVSNPLVNDLDADGNDLTNVGAANVGSANTESAIVKENLDAKRVGEIQQPRGGVMPTGEVTFASEFLGKDFDNGNKEGNPMDFQSEHFDDGLYRVIIQEGTTENHKLYKEDEFGSRELVETDILPNREVGAYSLQDHVVLDDGTFVVYETADEGGSNNHIEVWTGDSLTNLTAQGSVIDGYTDVGAVRIGDTIHLYTEGAGGDSNNADIMRHYTTNTSDLTSSTYQGDALDVTGRSWTTGDPDIIKMGDYYYVFTDRWDDTYYYIALCRFTDPGDWQVIDDNITPQQIGGDLVVTKRGGVLNGYTEYSGNTTGGMQPGIGRWRLWPTPLTQTVQSVGVPPNFRDSTGELGRFSHPSAGENLLDVSKSPDASDADFDQTGFRIVDKSGNVVGKFVDVAGKPTLTSPSGKSIGIGPSGSGQTELTVANDYVREDTPQGNVIVPQPSKPTNPASGEVKRVIADGTNWDPDADGNAESGWLLPDGTFVEDADFGTTL